MHNTLVPEGMSTRETTPDGTVRYSIKHQLGSGGEGSVFLGRLLQTGEIVAVKVGHPGSAPAMMREARVLSSIPGHKNVIPRHYSVHEGRSKRGIIVSVSRLTDHGPATPANRPILKRCRAAGQGAASCRVMMARVRPRGVSRRDRARARGVATAS